MPIDAIPTCRVIHAGATAREGKQGLSYFAGVSRETAGARGICMHLLTIPPGGRAKAHLHRSHETAIYVLSGEGEMWYGEGLRERSSFRAGDFVYIPAGVAHLPVNLSQTEPCLALVARTDPNEQESVVVLPELDALIGNRACPWSRWEDPFLATLKEKADSASSAIEVVRIVCSDGLAE